MATNPTRGARFANEHTFLASLLAGQRTALSLAVATVVLAMIELLAVLQA